MIPRIPRQLCNQSITLELLTGKRNAYNKPEYAAPVEVANVLVQPQTVYSGTNDNRQLVANGVIFLFAGVSTPLPKLTPDQLQSRVTFEGRKYLITNITENRNPYSNDVYSYEIEVV